MKKIYLLFFFAIFCFSTNAQISVGILGGALSSQGHGFADADLNLENTGDDVNFVLTNVFLTTAPDGLKFRQDDAWTINWGNTNFPNGRGFLNGANISTVEGTYDIYFHIDAANGGNSTYSFQPAGTLPSVGVLGAAVVGHGFGGPDLVLATSDGITYTANDVQFVSGEFKFRQDTDWSINWGGTLTPDGSGTFTSTGLIDSAANLNIDTAGTSGSFDISFNRHTNQITLTDSTLSFDDFVTSGIQARFVGGDLVVKGLNEEATISGYDLLGRKLFSFKRSINQNFQENLPLPKNQIGVVRIESNSFQKTLKVVPQ